MLPACASAVNYVLSTHMHQVALKLYHISDFVGTNPSFFLSHNLYLEWFVMMYKMATRELLYNKAAARYGDLKSAK